MRNRHLGILTVVVEDVGRASVRPGFNATLVRTKMFRRKTQRIWLTLSVHRKLEVFNFTILAEDLTQVIFVYGLGKAFDNNLQLRKIDISALFKLKGAMRMFGFCMDVAVPWCFLYQVGRGFYCRIGFVSDYHSSIRASSFCCGTLETDYGCGSLGHNHDGGLEKVNVSLLIEGLGSDHDPTRNESASKTDRRQPIGLSTWIGKS